MLVSYKYCSFARVVTCVGEQRYDECLSLNHCNTFLTTNMAEAKRTYTEVSECDVTVQWVYKCPWGNTWNKQPITDQSDYSISLKYGRKQIIKKLQYKIRNTLTDVGVNSLHIRHACFMLVQ